jgi:hypothetical protein
MFLFYLFYARSENRIATPLKSIIFHTLLVSFFVLHSFSQRNQVSWISSHFSVFRSLSSFFAWPIIGSERSLNSLEIALYFFAVISIVSVGKITLKESDIEQRIWNTLIASSFIPATILLVISLVTPIFHTRYFAYSTVAFSLMLGQIFTINFEKRRIQFAAVVLILLSLENGVHIFNSRGGDFNWGAAIKAIATEPDKSLVLSYPSWYKGLVEYRIRNAQPISLSVIERRQKGVNRKHCMQNQNTIWVFYFSQPSENDHVRTSLEQAGYIENRYFETFDQRLHAYIVRPCNIQK